MEKMVIERKATTTNFNFMQIQSIKVFQNLVFKGKSLLILLILLKRTRKIAPKLVFHVRGLRVLNDKQKKLHM